MKYHQIDPSVCEFFCRSPSEFRVTLPNDKDVVAFQCQQIVHRAHYEIFKRALDAENVGEGGILLVHITCGPTRANDLDGNTFLIPCT